MVTAKTKALFFDRKAVTDAVGKVKAAALAKAGAFVRTAARSSMRPAPKSGKVAEAGKPPYARKRLIKDAIAFAYDPASASVVVGPDKVNTGDTSPDQGTVPGALERGGSVIIRASGTRKQRVVKLAAHPFMAPAMEKEAPKFPDLFKA